MIGEISVIIPIYKPDYKFTKLLHMLVHQNIDNMTVTLIDSGSDKSYIEFVKKRTNFKVIDIDVKNFDHGGTRQLGIERNPQAEVYVFLTQDAILSSEDDIKFLVESFHDSTIGCAYGKQLPHQDASLPARLAREYNYGNINYKRYLRDKKTYGMKVAFISNSFAAYRKTAICEVGGFPANTILSEDMMVAAKMLLKGWGIAYCANAKVYHSHNYTVWQEFKRYFDIGVFQGEVSWIREKLGAAEKSGMGFVSYELHALRKCPWKIPAIIMRDGAKYIGYRLGIGSRYIPGTIKRRISMNSAYWDKRRASLEYNNRQ